MVEQAPRSARRGTMRRTLHLVLAALCYFLSQVLGLIVFLALSLPVLIDHGYDDDRDGTNGM